MTYKQWAAKQTGLEKSVKPLEKSVKSGIMPTNRRQLQNKLSYEWKGEKNSISQNAMFSKITTIAGRGSSEGGRWEIVED